MPLKFCVKDRSEKPTAALLRGLGTDGLTSRFSAPQLAVLIPYTESRD